METVSKILVGLDLSKFDQYVISYTKFINSILKPSKIHFVHIQKELNVPEEILELYPALEQEIEKNFLEEMVMETEGRHIPGVDIQYDVYKGTPFQELLAQANKEHTDLLIVGKQDDESSTEKKLARKICTNILFVPEIKKRRLKKILVPIDFSKDAIKSLRLAIEIAKKSDAEIYCQNIYDIPTGYNKTGKTYEEFAEIMKSNIKGEFEDLYDKIDFKNVKVNPPIISLNNHKKIAHKILEKSDELEIDLIVIGARGRTKVASILLGSVAETLVMSNLSCPLLLSKKDPNHLMSFWESLNHI